MLHLPYWYCCLCLSDICINKCDLFLFLAKWAFICWNCWLFCFLSEFCWHSLCSMSGDAVWHYLNLEAEHYTFGASCLCRQSFPKAEREFSVISVLRWVQPQKREEPKFTTKAAKGVWLWDNGCKFPLINLTGDFIWPHCDMKLIVSDETVSV